MPRAQVTDRNGGSSNPQARGVLSLFLTVKIEKSTGQRMSLISSMVLLPAYLVLSIFSAISINFVTVFQFLPVPEVLSVFTTCIHESLGCASPLGK